MRILRDPREVWPGHEGLLGFVPTMGALHEGHLHLMRKAREECGTVAASIFVNPTQFGKGEDFERYPRDERADFALAESAGVDLMFAPSAEAMYTASTTSVKVAGVTDRWEGAARPGHFDGVATVVAKLFHIVGPDRAYFGEKDYQQCVVIRRMVEDLNFRVDVRIIETVREPDGLALSSRNRYLSGSDRQVAPHLHRCLVRVADELSRAPAWEAAGAQAVLEDAEQTLRERGFLVEYLALVQERNLEPYAGVGSARLLVAARLSGTRLIDNTAVPLDF